MADALLLETGDYLLLEDGTSHLLLQNSVYSVSLSESNVSIGSDTISRQLIATRTLVESFTGLLLLQNGDFLLLEDGIDRLVLEYPGSTPGIVITDSLARQYIGTRTITESNTGITDNVARELIVGVPCQNQM